MAEFIIKSVSEEERYICYDKIGKMSVTNRPEKAVRFADAGKAWNALTNHMPKKKRDGWKVVSYEKPEQQNAPAQRVRVDLDTSSMKKDDFDWEKVKKNISESFSEIIAYKDKLSSQLSQVEAELCDCEHYCEFFKCDAAHGYKLYAMIRERRIKRRFIKDELRRANSVLSMSYTDIANGDIEKVFKEISEQSYEPRVLKELFSDVLKPSQPAQSI